MDDQQTHYDVLGLPHHAHVSQVNKQYRALRAELLEMGVPFDDPYYETLSIAYRILHDHYLRQKYDEQLKAKGLYQQAGKISSDTPLSALFGDSNEAEADEWVLNEDVPEPVASANKQIIDVVQLATTLENVNLNPPEVEVPKKKAQPVPDSISHKSIIETRTKYEPSNVKATISAIGCLGSLFLIIVVLVFILLFNWGN